MKENYYKILNVRKNASADDLKEAYHELAMKWHPSKNPKRWKTPEFRLKQVCEAYQVLIDPKQRALYDKYGVEGLKGQVTPRNSKESTFKADEAFGGGGGASVNHPPQKPDPIEYGVEGLKGQVPPCNSKESTFKADEAFGGGEGASVNHRPQKPDPIEVRLPCSLEELYEGSRYMVRIFRKITTKSGEVSVKIEILTIDIKPGSEKENKIIFREKGHERPNMLPSDVVVIIDEKPHNVFTRDGNDLVVRQNISSSEALSGYTVNLTTLDGKSLKIPINKVITPSYEEIVEGEGMPIIKERYEWDKKDKGNLRIKFNITH